MPKIKNTIADEVFASMQHAEIVKTASANAVKSNAYLAAKSLDKAAELLDNIGMHKEANVVTNLIKKIANV